MYLWDWYLWIYEGIMYLWDWYLWIYEGYNVFIGLVFMDI